MRLYEIKKKLGYHPSVLRYPYRVLRKNNKVVLKKDKSMGLTGTNKGVY